MQYLNKHILQLRLEVGDRGMVSLPQPGCKLQTVYLSIYRIQFDYTILYTHRKIIKSKLDEETNLFINNHG